MVLALVLCLASACAAVNAQTAEFIWVDGMEGGLLANPPVDLTRVSAILPQGDVDGGTHVIPVDHLYVQFDATTAQPVVAMGPGELTMVVESEDLGNPDYELFIRHSERLATQIDHLSSLAPDIQLYIEQLPDAWIDLEDSRLLVLDDVGSPPPLILDAGQFLGMSRINGGTLDVGVVDIQLDNGQLGRGIRRIPSVADILDLLGVPAAALPFNGHRAYNGGCFVDYLPDRIRNDWVASILRFPEGCGSLELDVAGSLQGSWFNPALDTLPEPALDTEQAAFVLIPFNQLPETDLRLVFGSSDPLALLDPGGLNPASESEFSGMIDPTPGTAVNPWPSDVTAATGTVCYDMFTPIGPGSYNLFFLRLNAAGELSVRWDQTSRPAPACQTELPLFDNTFDATFVR